MLGWGTYSLPGYRLCSNYSTQKINSDLERAYIWNEKRINIDSWFLEYGGANKKNK